MEVLEISLSDRSEEEGDVEREPSTKKLKSRAILPNCKNFKVFMMSVRNLSQCVIHT